jgi:hypothetical protein
MIEEKYKAQENSKKEIINSYEENISDDTI